MRIDPRNIMMGIAAYIISTLFLWNCFRYGQALVNWEIHAAPLPSLFAFQQMILGVMTVGSALGPFQREVDNWFRRFSLAGPYQWFGKGKMVAYSHILKIKYKASAAINPQLYQTRYGAQTSPFIVGRTSAMKIL